MLPAATFTEIRDCSKTSQKSLYTKTPLEYKQIISHFSPKQILDRPNYLTVQISDCQHIMLEPESLQYLNHSCSPNVFFNTIKMQLIALCKIKAGEELTIFYPSTEWSMDRGFNCLCQSENCLGYIQGAFHIDPNILLKYNLSKHIQQKLSLVHR